MINVPPRSILGALALGFAFLGCIGVGLLIFRFMNEKQVSVRPTDGQASGSAAEIPKAESKTIDARQVWVNTNIQVEKGAALTIDATGQINVAEAGDGADKWVGPDGWGYIPLFYCDGQPCRYVYRTPDSLGCLIGRIGNGKPFKIGSHYTTTAQADGILYLSVNDSISDHTGKILDDSNAAALMFSTNRGAFNVTIRIQESIPKVVSQSVIVNGNDKWKDTGIRVSPGQTLIVSASGTVTWGPPGITDGTNVVDPNGTRPPYGQDAARFPVPEAGIGSLVMRIGRMKYAVGSSERIEVKEPGTIELMVNDDAVGDNSGSFNVRVEVK